MSQFIAQTLSHGAAEKQAVSTTNRELSEIHIGASFPQPQGNCYHSRPVPHTTVQTSILAAGSPLSLIARAPYPRKIMYYHLQQQENARIMALSPRGLVVFGNIAYRFRALESFGSFCPKTPRPSKLYMNALRWLGQAQYIHALRQATDRYSLSAASTCPLRTWIRTWCRVTWSRQSPPPSHRSDVRESATVRG